MKHSKYYKKISARLQTAVTLKEIQRCWWLLLTKEGYCLSPKEWEDLDKECKFKFQCYGGNDIQRTIWFDDDY